MTQPTVNITVGSRRKKYRALVQSYGQGNTEVLTVGGEGGAGTVPVQLSHPKKKTHNSRLRKETGPPRCTVLVKVKVTLEQATKAQKGSRCIALLFLQPRRQMRVGGQRHAPSALPPGKRRGTHCIGSWMCPRTGMDVCGKSRPHRGSIPGPLRPLRVAIPTGIMLTQNCTHLHVGCEVSICLNL